MEFRLLGPVEVLEDGRALPLGGRRQRAVLTHLVLSRGSPVARDLLIEQVWADAAPGAVRASLHTYVSRLRATLGAARLETRSAGYVLHAGVEEVDALRFEQALGRARTKAAQDPGAAADDYGAALALWRGPALGDLADERSLRATAVRLEALHDRAVEERLAARLACGDHLALVPELADLVDRCPLREDLWGQYVVALYRSDRQGEALTAWERARRLLADELGVEPGPALRRLHQQLLRQDPELLLSNGVLHGYRLQEVLGEGSSAVVHRARQPAVGREVAVKVLHRHVADDPELVHRFASAAQAAAALEQPHVVPLHDFWRGPEGAVLVLRLMRGGTLAEHVLRTNPELDVLLPLLEQVATGLDACARQGVVHVELHPSDVLLDEEGNAHVSPFVLARDVARRRRQQVSATTSGAAHACAGEPERPDVRALAALLCRLTRRLPDTPLALRRLAERAAQDGGGHRNARSFLAAAKHAAFPSAPAQRAPASRPAPLRNPYKGLRAFGEADAADFFGRKALVERLVARLAGPPGGEGLRFLAVVGPSGSGKSSVVRAGLLPALRAGGVPDVGRWYVVDVVPGHAPLAELETALRRVAVEPLPAGTAEQVRAEPTTLLSSATSLLRHDHGGGSAVLLLVDQFEELFTLAAEHDRRAFVAALVAAVTAPGSRVRVVVTLRADFYDRPLRHPELAELLRAGTEVVAPLTPEGLEQAVVEPAERAGLRVEPGLLAQVVADVGDAPAALPMLQFALTELAARARGGSLSLAGYRAVGGVAGALVRRADGVHSRFTSAQQSVARQVLLQLVQPSDAGVDTRRRVLVDELVHRTDDADTAQEVVVAFGAARLLAFDRDPSTRAPTVEVAHEALLREWALLRRWTDAARDDLRLERRFGAATREWDETGRDPSFLATGSRLDAVERWATRWSASTGWSATALERAYLEESLRAREQAAERERDRLAHERALEQRSVQRLRAVAALLAVAVLAATALTVFGFAQRDRAQRESVVAEARALAAASVASLDVDPERAALLALEAVRRTREQDGAVLPEAEEALHRAVVASRVVLTVRGVGGAVAWSAGGLLVTEGPEQTGVVDLRAAATGRPVRAFQGHDVDVNQVAFSPDGSRLLTTGDDGAARMWDPGSGRLLWEHRIAAGAVWGPSFSRDGRRVSAAWQDEGVVAVLDAATGAVAGEVRSVAEPRTTALSADGATVFVAGEPVPGALVHDVRTGQQVLHLDPGGPAAYGVDVSADGRWVATSGVDLQARLWSLPEGAPGATLHGSAPVADLDWSPDSSQIVLGGADGVARVFRVGGRSTREVLRLSSSGLRGVTGAAFSPDGRRVLLGNAETTLAQVWDVSTGGSREWATIAAPELEPIGADFTTGGRHVVVSSHGGRLAVHDATDGSVVRRTAAVSGTVGAVRASPDGSLVAGTADGAAHVWDVASGARVAALPDAASTAGWSADGSRLALVSENGRLRFVDRHGQPVPPPQQAPAQGLSSVAFSPQGSLLVTVSSSPGSGTPGQPEVEVHDRRTGAVRARWLATAELVVVAPDGRHAVTTQPDGDVAVRTLRTGRRVQTLVGHTGSIRDAVFSPDGGQLATAGQDGSVRLWDLRTGARSLVLRGHTSVVYTVRFSPDGSRLVTASGDGTVRVWALALDDLTRLAAARLTRSFTEDECRRYLLHRTCPGP